MRRAPTLEARLRATARESDPARVLPYARHVSDQVVSLDSGALMLSLALDGVNFETADAAELETLHERLNSTWRNLAAEDLAVWHHLVRRRATELAKLPFRSAFAEGLDEGHRRRLADDQLIVNELYLTLVLKPGAETAARTQAWVRRIMGAAAPLDRGEDVKRLEDLGRELCQHLARYGPRRLGLRENAGVVCSEPLGLVRLALTGDPRPVPLVRGHLGSAACDRRLIFGHEALEIRDVAHTRFAGMLGVKEYPPTTRPGLWNGLLALPFPLVASQSFTFLSKASAAALLSRKQNQLLSARDRAASQIEDLDAALDDLMSNRFVMGEHQASVLAYGETPQILAENLASARAVLADSGVVACREDLGLEAAFWSQFPGNFRLRLRPAAISSRNFASLAPLHSHPRGQAAGCHWGAPVARLRTSAGSPYDFSFHVGDVGHTFICGPSGSGKTVIQNFMLAQLERLGAQQVFIDKDRGAEIFVRACGGTYLTLSPGAPTGFAPFRALPYDPANRAFLASLVRRMVSPAGGSLTPTEANAIDEAVGALAAVPSGERSISALRALLGQRDAAGLGARLSRWARGGPLGWALDGDIDVVAFDAPFVGFDMTHLLDAPEVCAPVMMYLFHRLQALADGRRLVVDVDEFWKALGDEAFRGLAQDGLKTWRKQNAFLVFGTQSPADVLRSPIAHIIVEQCATQIFLPNPHATERDYIDGFGLSPREFDLVRQELEPGRRSFLVKQGLNSVVLELDLNGQDDALAVLSGRAQTVALLERVRASHGDDPARWLPMFHAARRGLT